MVSWILSSDCCDRLRGSIVFELICQMISVSDSDVHLSAFGLCSADRILGGLPC